MKPYIINILLLTSFLFTNCNFKSGHRNGERIVTTLINESTDSIRIPKAPDGGYIGIYYRLKYLEQQLNLKPLDKRAANFEFRVWFDLPGLALHQRLFILRCEQGRFSCDLIRFKLDWWTDRKKEPLVINSDKSTEMPKSGWNHFSEQLFSNDFPMIFDIDKMEPRSVGIDGGIFCFELFSGNHYWMSEFNDPRMEEQNDKLFLEVKKIVKLIEVEFDISRKIFRQP